MPRRRKLGTLPGRAAQHAQHAQRVHDVDSNADTLEVDRQEIIDLAGSPRAAGKAGVHCCWVCSMLLQ